MELVLLIVIIVIGLALWARTDEISERHRRADEELRDLQARLAIVQREVATMVAASARISVPAPGVAPHTVAAPEISPADRPPVARALHAPEAAAAGGGPAVLHREARQRQGSPSRRARPSPPARREWIPPAEVPAQPVPGLVQQVLLRLGLTSPESGEGWSRATLEAWLEGRMLAVVGGIALLLGAVFFLSLAFSRGWITEPLRVLIGLAVGVGLLVLGELSFARLRGILGPVLVAVGLATVSLALFAATRLYDLVPVEWGLAGAFVAAVAAAAIAVRHDSQLVAALGLVAVLASPPILGASPTLVTLLFMAAALVGTTGVALFRTWVWLPPLAFVLVVPQLASYVTGGPPVPEGLIVVAGFWLVNLVAAGGEELRHSTDRLRSSSVTLLLADATFAIWAGFTILSGPQDAWRGSFLLAMAAAYLGLGLLFLVRNGDRHPFGMIVAATGAASLAMAVPVQFGGPLVPIAWTAEAVALGWVAVLRRHPYSAGVSVLLAALAAGHLVSIEYRPFDLVGGFARSIPFVGPEGMTFAFMTAAIAVTALIVPIAWVRAGLAVVGGVIAIYVFPFELSGPALVAAWVALASAGLVLYAHVVGPRIAGDFREDRVPALGLPRLIVAPVAAAVALLSAVVRPAVLAVAVVAGVGAIAHLVSLDYPANAINAGTPHDIPFVGLPGLAFAILLAAIVATGLFVPIAWVRIGLTALGGLIALYVFPFELSGPALVAAWAALATAGFVIEARIIEPRVGPAFDPAALMRYQLGAVVRPAVLAVGAIIGVAVLGHLVLLDFPIDRLGRLILSSVPYAGPEGLSLGAALAGLGAVGWVMRARWIQLGMIGIGGALLVFTMTFELAVPQVAVSWGLLALASLFVVRRFAFVGLVPGEQRSSIEMASEHLPYAAAGLALLFLIVQSLSLADPVSFANHLTGGINLGGTPFLDQRTAVLAILAVTVLLAGLIWRRAISILSGGVLPVLAGGVAGGLVIAWLLPFEVRPGYAIVGWSALALAGLRVLRIVPTARLLLGLASIGLALFGCAVAVAVVAPPDRLIVDQTTTVLGWPLLTDATVALGALAIAIGAGALLHRGERLSLPALIAAGVEVAYLLSVAVVDQFQLQVAARPLEELQKESQVGLSVLWSILGAAGFAIGLVTRRPAIRLFGLGLLGLATVKVFLVDLAALDVAYRVLSLVALGVLLLVSAAIYSRMQHPPGPIAPQH